MKIKLLLMLMLAAILYSLGGSKYLIEIFSVLMTLAIATVMIIIVNIIGKSGKEVLSEYYICLISGVLTAFEWINEWLGLSFAVIAFIYIVKQSRKKTPRYLKKIGLFLFLLVTAVFAVYCLNSGNILAGIQKYIVIYIPILYGMMLGILLEWIKK